MARRDVGDLVRVDDLERGGRLVLRSSISGREGAKAEKGRERTRVAGGPHAFDLGRVDVQASCSARGVSVGAE